MNNVMYPEDSQGQSFKLKASVQTYELNLQDLSQLFARELGVPADRISITERKQVEHGDAIGEFNHVFGGVVVTVKG